MMNYKMSDLKGIDPNQVEQLAKGGVVNTDEMMRDWNDVAKRQGLATTTGLDLEQIGRLASLARVARLRGVGPRYAELLVTAGVRGRKSLATFTPESLVKHLGDVTAAKSLPGPVPTLVEVGAWFEELNPAPVSDTKAS